MSRTLYTHVHKANQFHHWDFSPVRYTCMEHYRVTCEVHAPCIRDLVCVPAITDIVYKCVMCMYMYMYMYNHASKVIGSRATYCLVYLYMYSVYTYTCYVHTCICMYTYTCTCMCMYIDVQHVVN